MDQDTDTAGGWETIEFSRPDPQSSHRRMGTSYFGLNASDRRDWRHVQVRTGFRARSHVPVPVVDLPGYHPNPDVSTKHWLDWQQVSAIQVFSIQFMRRLSAELSDLGWSPATTWLEQRWDKTSCAYGHQAFLAPTADKNGAVLRTHIQINPVRNLAEADFQRIVTQLSVLYADPLAEIQRPRESSWDRRGPYGWAVNAQEQTTAPRKGNSPRSNHRGTPLEIVLTTWPFYASYRDGTPPTDHGLRRWPLNPNSEMVPIAQIYDPRAQLDRTSIPAVAELIVADVRRWGDFLGFSVGPVPTGNWHTQESHGSEIYKIVAPVSLTASVSELVHRVSPYYYFVTVSTEPRTERESYRSLVTIDPGHGFRVAIVDADYNGRYELNISSPAYDLKTHRPR